MRLLLTLLLVLVGEAGEPSLRVAFGPVHPDEVTLIWDKFEEASRGAHYRLMKDNQACGETNQSFFIVRGLSPGEEHTYTVELIGSERHTSPLHHRTAPASTIVLVTDHGAIGDGRTLNTKAIQASIDACPPGGTVRIPEGRFLSGALFLKDDLTFEIVKGGQLRGSSDPADYLPRYRNRFEGWESETLASLINAGKLDSKGPANVHRITLRGEGQIIGGGSALAERTIAGRGLRDRGRLICLMNAADVEVSGLTLEGSPSWTLHFIYSERVTCRNLTIRSKVSNGDGIDPDSAVDTLILGSTFETKDDCIAVKSGKNPEGNVIARPTERLRISGCHFLRGHGISIGSEISGGIRGVKVEDCVAGALLNGFQIKAIPARGGFVEDVEVCDCDLQKISILSNLNYNRDGEAAPTMPSFRSFRFRDIDLSKGDASKPIIIVNGFAAEGHATQNLEFERMRLPANAQITLDRAVDVTFKDIATTNGTAPTYLETHC
jgi:polygalacturonase